MDMESIWKAGGFYIYSIADTIALSGPGSRPKSVELWRIFSSNKNPMQLFTPENFHETPGKHHFHIPQRPIYQVNNMAYVLEKIMMY